MFASGLYPGVVRHTRLRPRRHSLRYRIFMLLLETGMIELTRQGGLHCASLYAVTWLPIDECGGKLDVNATAVASGLWKQPKRKAA